MTPLSEALLNWYREHQRQLPWRGATDPYAIWISEIMLQQTRVETVIPYYLAWMQRFPNLQDLVQASEKDILSVWEGLGYYSRARNMLKAAHHIVERYFGEFPSTIAELEEIPGIGTYTAAAIASIAFGMDVPAVDGNVKRVISRLINLESPIESTQSLKIITEVAKKYLPPGRAAEYNQAFMDLSAAICLPKVPRCLLCPLQSYCQALEIGVADQRPLRKPRRPIPHHTVTAAVIECDGKYLISRRPKHGLLGGLWEFPGGKVKKGETLSECLKREILEELDAEVVVGDEFGVYRHAYTHFKITLYAFRCWLTDMVVTPVVADEIAWIQPAELKKFPMGKVDRLIADKLMDEYD